MASEEREWHINEVVDWLVSWRMISMCVLSAVLLIGTNVFASSLIPSPHRIASRTYITNEEEKAGANLSIFLPLYRRSVWQWSAEAEFEVHKANVCQLKRGRGQDWVTGVDHRGSVSLGRLIYEEKDKDPEAVKEIRCCCCWWPGKEPLIGWRTSLVHPIADYPITSHGNLWSSGKHAATCKRHN